MSDWPWVAKDDFNRFSADAFLQSANRLIGDVWTQHTIDNIPQMAGDIWTQHVTNQLPNLTSMLAPPAAPPPQTATAAPPDPFSLPTPPNITPTTPTAPAVSPGADSGIPPPAPPPVPAAGVPGPVTETTAGLSGGGQGTGNMTDRAQGILAGGAQAASWLGDQGQKALQAVLVTEGGLNNARGDQGKSAGPLQFYEGGQLANLAQQLGMSLEQAKGWVEQNPVEAIKWAIGTPDKPGYLGGAIQRGLQAGLQGADLATYAQRHGQVSVSPERAGQNFQALFGTGQEVLGGAGQVVQSVASTVGGAVQEAGQQAAKFVGNLVPNQFGDPNLSTDEAYAACGPAAAIAFARANGRNPTLREAVDMAKSVGWTAGGGMNGIANEKALLDKMGIASTLDPNPTWDKIAADASSGNPVAISTPRHYFVADGFDPQTGKYHVGASGTAFRAGAEWMTAEQIANIGGGVNGALFADHPSSPQPSVAVADQQAQVPVKKALSQFGASTDQQAASTGQPQSLWDRLGGGISDVFKNVFGGGSPSTPPPPPEGGGYGAVPPGGQNPLDQIGRGTSSAVSDALSQVNLNDPTRSVIGGNPVAPATMPTSTELIQHAEEQKNRAIEENNPLRDVPLIGGLTTGAAQAVDPLMFAAGPLLGTAAGALPVGAGLAGTLARGAVQGAGFGAIQGATQPEADVGSTLRGAAIGAGLGAAGEGGLAALERLRPSTVARAATGPPPQGIDWAAANRADPANVAVGDMLQARVPQTEDAGLYNRFVRAWTNRYEALDRYQADALNAAGLDPTMPPPSLDAAALRRLSSDPAAEVRLQQGLGPALQQVAEPEAKQALSTYLIHQNNIDVAAALGNPDRAFSGGLKAADSQRALQSMEQALGPQGWQHLENTAGQVYDFVGTLRQRMVDSGLIDAQTAAEWDQKYPHWVPTRILDYLDDPAAATRGAQSGKLSLANNGVRSYTEEGTTKFREDPLGSIVGLTNQVESLARKNEAANAVVELDKLRPEPQRLLKLTDDPATNKDLVIQRVVDGQVERYLAPKELAAAINGPQITQAPGFVRAWTSFLRNVTTILSPTFALVRNPSLDVPEYVYRELARSGGDVRALPAIMGELVRGYADAFQGYRPQGGGQFAGAGTQQFLLGGGGGSGMATRTLQQRGQVVQDLSRAGGTEIQNFNDVAGFVKDLVTLKPVAAVSERTELGPRIASMRLAEQRGATPIRAVINGRSVTIDFNEGGTLAKTINSFVPFFNAGIQGTASTVRSFRENPAGALTSAVTMAGLPAMMAEAWNRSDPQRSADYNDVPQYLKDQGVVIMLPGDVPTDQQGNRKPQFWWVNMRGLAPFSIAAREVAEHVLSATGNGQARPEDWGGLLSSIGWSTSPIRASTVGDVPGSLMPQFVPGAPTALQIATNKDFFRGSDIVTARHDQNAPVLAQMVANGLTTLARLQNPAAQVHPSQVDFAVRDLLGGVGSTVLAAGDVAAGYRPDTTPQTVPVAGGVARALGVRSDIGQTLQTAKNAGLRPEAQRVLDDINIPPVPPVTGNLSLPNMAVPLPLHQTEEALYQQQYAQHLSDLLEQAGPTLRQIPTPQAREQVVRKFEDAARRQAAGEVLASLNGQDVGQRLQQEAQRRFAPPNYAATGPGFAVPAPRQ